MHKIVIATSLRARLIGMLSSSVCAQGETLVLVPCSSIHTIGMRGKLDIAFVDGSGCVLSTYRAVPPFRLLRDPDAVMVLERRAGFSETWFEAGQVLELVEAIESKQSSSTG